jgi:ATP-binding cassette subfamily B protein
MNLLIKLIYEFLGNNVSIHILYLIIILITYILESIIIPRQTSSLVTNLSGNLDIPLIKNVFTILLIFWSISQVTYSADSYIRTIITPKFHDFIKEKMLKSIIKYYKKNFNNVDQNVIISRLLLFPSLLKSIIDELLKNLLPKTLILIAINIYLYMINFNIGISTTIMLIAHIVNVMFLSNCNSKIMDASISNEQLLKNVGDKIQNLHTIYSYGMEDKEIDNLQQESYETNRKFAEVLECSCFLRIRSYIINIVGFAVINYFNFILLENKLIDSKTFTSILLTVIFMMTYLVQFASYITQFEFSLGMLDTYKELFKIIENDYNTEEKPSFEFTNGNIEIKKLNFKQKDDLILNNLDLKIEKNEKIGIFGKSGSGKSTLINLILGFYDFESGNISVDNQDITKYDLNSYRKNIALVSQNTKLFNKSIIDNITYGSNKSLDDVKQIIKTYKLDNILNMDLTNDAGINGDNLSGGQKQIVLLLRAYFGNKNIIFFDEPTSAIDKKFNGVIINFIKEICKNKTCLIVSHDNNILNILDKAYELKDGKLNRIK